MPMPLSAGFVSGSSATAGRSPDSPRPDFLEMRRMATPGRIGFRVLPSPEPLEAEIVSGLGAHASATLADAMGRFNFMDEGIRSRTGLSLCGVAVTVNARPADNLMVHKAL